MIETPPRSPRQHPIVFAYLGFLFLAVAAAGILLIRRGRDWGFGDWFINYQGGFVRRGLTGEIALQVGRLLHLDPAYIVAVLGIACYATLFYAVWQLALRSSLMRGGMQAKTWWITALLISPVTLAFPVISRTSYRKEILLFALLGALVLWLINRAGLPGQAAPNSSRNDLLLALALSLALPLIILSHEPMVAYFPYVAAALAIAIPSLRRVALILAFPVVLSAAATLAAVTHIGGLETVRRICASLGTPSLDNCSQAVQTLAQTREYALAYTAGFIQRYHYLRQYGIALFLGLIPIVAACIDLRQRRGARRSVNLLLASVCIAFPLSLSLFRYGVDWGRWIQIHMMSLCLLILLIDVLHPAPIKQQISQPARLKPAMTIFFFVYATCWSMPGVKDIPRLGYVSHLQRILHWNGSLTSQDADR